MSALIDRYWTHYGITKRSASREKSILEGIRLDMGRSFVREIDGETVGVGTKASQACGVCRREPPCGTSMSCTT
jgi:hypothetical protein